MSLLMESSDRTRTSWKVPTFLNDLNATTRSSISASADVVALSSDAEDEQPSQTESAANTTSGAKGERMLRSMPYDVTRARSSSALRASRNPLRDDCAPLRLL